MRIPAATQLIARTSDVTIDARAFNGVIEAGDVVKRPGVATTSYNYANAQGALGMKGFLILVYGDELEIFDYVPIPPPIYIGDLVGGYYAMVNNPSTTPGPGDPYWSATPPGTTRWRGKARISVSYGLVAAISPEGSDYLIGPIAASKEAAAKVWVEVVIGARLSGVAVLNTYNGFNPDYVIKTVTFNSFPSYTYYSGNSRIEMSINAKEVTYSGYPGSWPSGASYTGLTTYSDYVGIVAVRQSLPSFTITSSGTTGKITSLYLAGPYNLIEISGADQPEYNGVFFAKLDLSTVKPWDTVMDEWIFTLPGVPAASPATGSIVVYAY